MSVPSGHPRRRDTGVVRCRGRHRSQDRAHSRRRRGSGRPGHQGRRIPGPASRGRHRGRTPAGHVRHRHDREGARRGGGCVMTGYDDFEQFVVARRNALLRTAYLLTGNHHDAEDLVQAALIKVVPKWARIADRPEPYVRKVLARESVNRWRGRRWREVTTDVVPELMHHDGTDRIALLDDLRRLSPRQRAVLVLRYFDDLTEADTAAALGISVETVKSHARDALERLRHQQTGEEQSTATA